MRTNARKRIDLTTKLRRDWCELIDECILGAQAERDREILKMALLDGKTNAWIAEHTEPQMSEAQVQRVVKKRTEELYKAWKRT